MLCNVGLDGRRREKCISIVLLLIGIISVSFDERRVSLENRRESMGRWSALPGVIAGQLGREG